MSKGAGNVAARLVDDFQYLQTALERLGVNEDPEIQDILESLRENIVFFV